MTDSAMSMLAADRSLTVLTGAGMSTASGIPDFRGPQGLWTTNPGAARLYDINAYMSDAQVRRDAWQARRDHPAWNAQPNAGHRALAELERQGRLRALVTQNIDGLHQAGGSREVLEVHGTIHRTVCMSCGERLPWTVTRDRLNAGEADPPCASCGGILKSDTISFGQSLDEDVLDASFAAAAECDTFVAIGTSLQVYPVAHMVQIALDRGIPVVIVNAEPTPFDDRAAMLIRERIEEWLPTLV